MMAGEINYNDLMYRSQMIWNGTMTMDHVNGTVGKMNGFINTETIDNAFPYTSVALLSIFICILPIIIMNLFFGIAVDDVHHIMKKSMINQKIKLVKVIWRYEKTLHLLLYILPRSLHKYIKPPLLSKDMKDCVQPIEKSSV